MTRRQPARPDRHPLLVTKRLVVHRPRLGDPEPPFDRRNLPSDGDPVWLAAPCRRLRAGYLCECGFGFEFADGLPDDWALARVVLREEEAATTYRDEDWVLSDRHGWIDEDEVLALAEQIELMPVGTVVERHGLGIAPLFEPIEVRPGHDPWWTLDVTDPHWSQPEGS
jgi:hypothetical protein